jgi:hypothetical protein
MAFRVIVAEFVFHKEIAAMSPSPVRSACALLALVVTASTALAQPALPTGMQKATLSSEKPAEYTFAAKTAGVLTIAINGEGDLAFAVTDADGQTLPDANIDRDLNGNSGLEMASVLIPEPGSYRVRVRLQGGSSSSFQISTTWLSFAALARENTDADSKPSGARRLDVAKPHEDALAAEAGDLWDWFSLQAPEAGTMVIVTRAVGESGDLVLEAYLDGKFGEAVERSDQDLQGDSANESVTIAVTKGQTVHVKVSGAYGRPSVKYRISSSLIP